MKICNVILSMILTAVIYSSLHCSEIIFRQEGSYEYSILTEGKGRNPVYGNEITVVINETDRKGEPLDRTDIGSNKKSSTIATYILGLEDEYERWEQLILQMKTGEKRLVRKLAADGDSYEYYTLKLSEIAGASEVKPYDIPGKTRIRTASGLEYIIIHQGSGTKAAPGYTVTFHFTGFDEDMNIFASSYHDEKPLTLTLGIDPMIMGWFEGICLMREGDQMRLIIPAELGYQEGGIPENVSADALLIFDIDLLSVK